MFGSRNGGGLTFAELRGAVQRDRFSDFLPLVAWDEREKGFLLVDDSYGYGYELTPSAYMFPEVHHAVSGLLNVHFDKGTIVQLSVFADPEIDQMLEEYSDLKLRPDPLVQAAKKMTAEFLSEGRHGMQQLSGTPLRNFRSFLWIKTRGPISADLRRQLEEMLSKLGIRRMDPEETVLLYRRLLNGVDTVQIGDFSTDRPIRKQIVEANAGPTFRGNEVRLGTSVARCLTPMSPPKRIDAVKANRLLGGAMGSVEDTDQIVGPFLYTLAIIFEETRDISQRHSMLSVQKGAGSFAVEVSKQLEEVNWVLDEQGNHRFIKFIPTFWVFGRNSAEARERGARVKRLWESGGDPWKMQEESYLNRVLLPLSLPFGLINDRKTMMMLERHFIFPAPGIATMAPVQTDFRGVGKPMLLFVGRKGQLIPFDLFDRRFNNHNFVVSAESGAGKSFLLNNIVKNYYDSGAFIRLIDIGGSYRKMSQLCSGRFIDVEGEGVVLNPFDMGLAADGEEQARAINMAVSIVGEMVNSSTQAPLSSTQTNLIKAAVQWTLRQGNQERGIDSVRDYLMQYPKLCDLEEDRLPHLESEARGMGFNLRDYCSAGMYGHFFNGKSTFNIHDDEFVVLELEALKNSPDLFNVMVMQVVNAVTQELYLSNRDKPRFILCDEAAQFMVQRGAGDLSRMGNVFAEGYRRARKYMGSFGIVLQSMNDLLLFGGNGQVILENAATRFLLQGSTYDKAVENKILDYEGFVLDLLKSVRNNKPHYSEVFIHSPAGAGIGRLVIDPFSYWIYTSAANEVAAFDRLVASGMPPMEAVCKLAGVDVSVLYAGRPEVKEAAE